MLSIKLNEKYEKILQALLIIATYTMIVVRFLLNEKGRVSPDSVRYMKQSHIFPVIDNTIAPLGYPLSIKFFAVFGLDEFWSSKLVGILAYTFILWFAYRRKFFFKELLVASALFSYVSIYSYTMSEAFILPFVVLFYYTAKRIIKNRVSTSAGIFLLSLYLIIMLNIRYSALFFCFGTLFFGIINIKRSFWISFVLSGLIGIGFYGLYKITFIDYFNENYLDEFLEIGLKPSHQLIIELMQGLTTTFNPLIHIANPNGGIINVGIYGLGTITILTMLFLFLKTRLSELERFILITCVVTIVCSYFIQYFYSVNALDYRLLSPFVLGIWMVFFRKLFYMFDNLTYGIAWASLVVGFIFTWLSRGDYLENRETIRQFIINEKLQDKSLLFYIKDQEDMATQVAELISTVHPDIDYTMKPEDTLKNTTLTEYKVESKIQIKKNKYQ